MVRQLLPQLYIIDLPVGPAYVWRDDDEITFVDAGTRGSIGLLYDAIGAIGLDSSAIKNVILTHFHHDHVGCAHELGSSGATVMAHIDDAAVIRGEATAPDPVLLDWEIPIFQNVRPLVPQAPATRVDRELVDGDTVDFGGGATIISVPGHTPGSIAIHVAQHGVLFTGDAVAVARGQVALGVFNVDRKRAIDSFRRVADLDNVEVACFGHGAPVLENAGKILRRAAANA